MRKVTLLTLHCTAVLSVIPCRSMKIDFPDTAPRTALALVGEREYAIAVGGLTRLASFLLNTALFWISCKCSGEGHAYSALFGK